MSSLFSVAQLFLVISALIILHEIGHYLGARLFKLEVEEFGFGIPPQALRFWRRKGQLKIGSTQVLIPAGTRALTDLNVHQWVEAITQVNENGDHILLKINVLDPGKDEQISKSEPAEYGTYRLRGILSEVKQGMLFTLNWLPLGGFVKIKGEGDTSVPDGLARANPWKRIIVYAFGPLMNLLLGVILYAVIVTQLGVSDVSKVLIMEVAPGSPAEAAGLQAGDLFYFYLLILNKFIV